MAGPKTIIGQSPPTTTPPSGVPLPPGLAGQPGYYVMYTYSDGTTELRFHYQENPGGPGVIVYSGVDQDVVEGQQGKAPARTPEKKTQDEREEAEKQRNQAETGFAETNQERAKRLADEQAEQRARDQADRQAAAERRQQATQEINARIAQQNYELAAAKFEAEQNQPTEAGFLEHPHRFLGAANVRPQVQIGQDERVVGGATHRLFL